MITSLAGFAGSVLSVAWSDGLAGTRPVITSLAGFAGGRPHPPGGRTATPAIFK